MSRVPLAALLLPLVVGCHSYRPVTTAAPEGVVRVIFTPARDVQLQREGMPARLLQDVVRVDGRVAAVSADTLFVHADEIRDGSGHRMAVPEDESARVLVVVDANVRVEQRQFSAGKTLAGATGLVLLLSTVALIALIDVLVRAAR